VGDAVRGEPVSLTQAVGDAAVRGTALPAPCDATGTRIPPRASRRPAARPGLRSARPLPGRIAACPRASRAGGRS
jgi:hypothetical protein